MWRRVNSDQFDRHLKTVVTQRVLRHAVISRYDSGCWFRTELGWGKPRPFSLTKNLGI